MRKHDMLDEAEFDQLRLRGEKALAECLLAERERLQRIVALRMDPKLAGRIDPGDIIQETFLEARKRLDRFVENPTVPVFVWLRGLTLEILIQAHRRYVLAQKRDATHEISFDAMGSNASSVEVLARCLADTGATPGHVLQNQERARFIESALALLETEDREVLTLRHFEQLSNDEVARIIGVKKSAASRRYTRALGRLREVLGGVAGFDWSSL